MTHPSSADRDPQLDIRESSTTAQDHPIKPLKCRYTPSNPVLPAPAATAKTPIWRPRIPAGSYPGGLTGLTST